MTQSSTTSASGALIATATLPQAIAAATELPVPDGYTLITIGFKEALNYNFVVSNPVSSAQIFAFLPELLNAPFGNQFQNISVTELVPLRSNSLNYLATVAKAYFPTSDIEELTQMIANTSSYFYSIEEGSAKYLAYLVDPNIPLTGLLGQTISGGTTSTSNSTSGSDNNSGSLDSTTFTYIRKSSDGKSSDSSGKTSFASSKGRVIGLVIGIVIGSCIYVMAMVLLIRKYIAKRQKANIIRYPDDSSLSDSASEGNYSHEKFQFNDAASITQSMKINNWMNESHYDDPAGPGIQTAQVGKRSVSMPKISRPIATQNSLGWNEI